MFGMLGLEIIIHILLLSAPVRVQGLRVKCVYCYFCLLFKFKESRGS